MTLKHLVVAVLIVMIGWMQWRLWVGEGSFAHVSGLEQEVNQNLSENEQKRQRNQVLKAEIFDLRAGLEAVEEKARSEFGLIKEGETFFLLVEE